MAKGFRLDRVPAGADPATYRPGIKRERRTNAEIRSAMFNALSDDEKAQHRQKHAEHNADMAQWRKDFDEHGPARAGEMLIQRKAQRGTDKIANFYARVAVEGNTDGNHDNVEGGE